MKRIFRHAGDRSDNAFIKTQFTLLLFLLSFPLLAQTTLAGRILDHEGAPLSFANVLLLRVPDSLLVKGAVATETGAYKLEGVGVGEYRLSVVALGYEPYFSEPFRVEADAKTIDRGTMMMENVVTLQAVEVLSQKPLFEQKLDRLVVNVENSITAAGGTVLDVLERSPGVTVNRQNNAITLGGKSGVVVAINGKLNRMPLAAAMQLLQSLNAAQVEKIELYAIPPAGYDAEGDAGMINIVLKKSMDQGVNGNYSLFAGIGRKPRAGGNGSFNWRGRGFNMYGDYGHNYFNTLQPADIHRTVRQPDFQLRTLSRNDREGFRYIHNGRLGLDYEASSRTTVGLLLSANSNHWRMDGFTTNRVWQDDKLISQIDLDINESNLWRHLIGNGYVRHSFANESTLSVDLDYLHYANDNPSRYFIQNLDGEGLLHSEEKMRVSKNTPIDMYVTKMDYGKALGEKMRLDVGLKSTLSRFLNDISLERLQQSDWAFDPELTHRYRLREDIAAGYVSLQAELDEKTSLNAGLRYEYTTSNLGTATQPDIVDRRYGNLFPSLFVSRKLSEHHQIQLSYGRRITRPTFNDLAPGILFFDPNSFLSGNPALQPALTNTLKLDYRWKSYLIYVQYSRDQSAIAPWQIRVIPETNQQIFTAENLDRAQTVNISLSLPWSVTAWWSMQNNITGIWQQSEDSFDGRLIRQEQRTLQLTTVHSFSLPKNFALEVTGNYRSAALVGFVRIQPQSAVNIGLRKKLPRDQGSLNLLVNDLFYTNYWRWTAFQPELNLDARFDFFLETRVVRLTYNRSFGSSKVKAAGKRTTGSQEEQRRVN